MAYADAAAVTARAGRIAAAWDDQSAPSLGDIDLFTQEVGGTIDSALAGRGLTSPAVGSSAALALAGLNADGALVLALEATFPAGVPENAQALLDGARARYAAGMTAIANGSHAAVKALEAGGGSPSATAFWVEEPEYGLDVPPEIRAGMNPYQAPGFERGQAL